MTVWDTSVRENSLLKYLPDDEEAESDGYSSPEVLRFREHFAIVIRQVSPAVAFGKPNPVRPYQFTQPRQHPIDKTQREESACYGRKLRQVLKRIFCLLGDLLLDFLSDKPSN